MSEYTDFSLLHDCVDCLKVHRLAVLPSAGGFYVGVRCECRDRNGAPRPYSRESSDLPTLELAEAFRSHLLSTRVAA